MSAREMLVAATYGALCGSLEEHGLAIFDAPPVRSGLPHVVVEDPVLTDWSTATWRGYEGRLIVVIHDAGERPVRLRFFLAMAEEVVAAMPPELGEGWRLAQHLPLRSRVTRGQGDRWRGTAEFLVRMFREDG